MDIDRYFYLAKCVLGFSAAEAWRLTVRQIAALMRIHNRFHGAQEAPEDDED